MDDILKLIESHEKENRDVLARLGARMIEQKQETSKLLATYIVEKDSSASTKELLNKAKVRDLEYWYTPLSEISGHYELGGRISIRLHRIKIYNLGDLVIKGDNDLLRLSGFGRKSLIKLKSWLKSIGEELGQELKEYRENQALLQHFDEKISYGQDGHAEHRKLRFETYHEVTGFKIYTIGELATSVVIMDMSDMDLRAIETCLKQWDKYLHPGMHLPYRPS